MTRASGGPSAGLRVTSPAPRGAWRELLAADPDALAFQSPEWLDAICAGGRYRDASRLYEGAGGGRLLLPMVRRAAPWPGGLAPQASMPHAWGAGGVVAEHGIEAADLDRVAADLAALPSLTTVLLPNPLHASHWRSAVARLGTTRARAREIPRCAHVLDLAEGAGEVWERRFRSAARRGVRKAERSGLEIECGSGDHLVDAFHRLLRLSFERWARAQHEPPALARWRGTRRDPIAKFRHMAASIGDSMRLWVASKEGVPVASILVLIGPNASYTRGAMDKRLAGPTAATDLLHWLAIQDACEAGCRSYHMGETNPSSSLARYKEKLGARPFAYAEYRFERLPLTRADRLARGLVKRVLRVRDA